MRRGDTPSGVIAIALLRRRWRRPVSVGRLRSAVDRNAVDPVGRRGPRYGRGRAGTRSLDWASDLVIGVVTDVGTLDDRNFNQYSWEAPARRRHDRCDRTDGRRYPGSSGLRGQHPSQVDDGSDIIVTVGLPSAPRPLAAATANPDIHFVGVDQFQTRLEARSCPELREPDLQRGPGRYLAGVVAGIISQSGEVGPARRHSNIPPVNCMQAASRTGSPRSTPMPPSTWST